MLVDTGGAHKGHGDRVAGAPAGAGNLEGADELVRRMRTPQHRLGAVQEHLRLAVGFLGLAAAEGAAPAVVLPVEHVGHVPVRPAQHKNKNT